MEKEKFLDLFREETRERVTRVLSILGEGDFKKRYRELMREAHTIKGAARMVGLQEISRFAHELEEIIQKISKGELEFEDEVLRKVLERGFSYLLSSSLGSERALEEGRSFLKKIREGSLDESELKGGATYISDEEEPKGETIKVETEKIEKSINLTEEIFMKAKSISKEKLPKKMEEEFVDLEKGLGELHLSLTSMRFTSLKPLLSSFSGTVSELARELGKEIRFVIEGTDVRLDERIIEEIREPLLHLIRNAVDHGIEFPEEREELGKQRIGLIKIRASNMGEMVKIEVIDDGRGIDIGKIRKKAKELGFINDEEDLGKEELLNFIFYPKFSTKEDVSEVSGRGYGMDIVKSKVEELGGKVVVETEEWKGTRVILLFPSSLVMQKVLLFRLGGNLYGARSELLHKIYRYSENSIKEAEGKKFFLEEERPVEFKDLRSFKEDGRGPGRIIVTKDMAFSFGVDEVLNEVEVIVRSPKGRLRSFPVLQGYTLYEGKIIPILNIQALKMFKTSPRMTQKELIKKTQKRKRRGKKILIVEDSPLSREFIKSMLKARGFEVLEAENGLEALGILEGEKIDLLVTDIEMPVMDGFTLIEKIRKSKLRDIPIIVVTSKGSENEIKRGMSAGADAYLVKGKFSERELFLKIGELLND